MSSAYAEAFVGDADAGRKAANQMLLMDIPISVGTDKTTYDHNDKIIVHGRVANVSGFPVTLTVVSPLNSVVTIAQIEVDNDGNYETTLSTEGGLWKHDGTYTIKVNYGTSQKSNKVFVELTGEASASSDNCSSSEIYLKGDYCVPYSISGGMVTGASINNNDNSVIVKISADEDGTLTLNPDESILNGIFMVLVDGQEWDEVEISGNEVTVMFPAGAEKIEVIGTFVIPEFGTIAVMILAVAIISIIAVSAKSRLSIMPRY
jgi:predicted secreted protein with PEFG-CTERM motif